MVQRIFPFYIVALPKAEFMILPLLWYLQETNYLQFKGLINKILSFEPQMVINILWA